MTHCKPKNIPNLGIKLCQLKCNENNLCSNFEYNVEDLPCRLSRNDSKKTEKPGGARCLSGVTSYSCPYKICSPRHRCLEPRSGKAVPDKKRNTHERCPQEIEDKLETQEDSPLHDACKNGDLGRVRRILSLGLVDVNSRDEKHRKTPLMVAAQEGHKRLFALLVERGANVSDVDENGDNVLHLACRGGRKGIVEYVVTQYSVDINSKGMFGSTPLLQTVYCGHRDVLKFLVTKGANLSDMNDNKENILHLACRGGHLGMVKYVLTQYSLDINSRENHGETPLMKAASEGHRDVFKFLVRLGADMSLVDNDGDNVLHHASIRGHAKMVQHILSQDMVDINSRGKYGRTPLMRATYYGHRITFDLLVSKDGLTQLVDDQGHNILHLAALSGQVEMVKNILSLNIVDINSRTNTGVTPLMQAAYKGHTDVFEFLVNKRAYVSHVDDDGDNILHYSSIGGHAKIVQLIILQNLVDINSRGQYGRTPLMRATYYGHRITFDLLVSKGGLTQLVDDQGHNILHLAALSGQAEMVKNVLSLNIVNINSRTNTGATPLMQAAYKGHTDVFEFLVNKRANVSHVDDDGDNIHYSSFWGHTKMVQYILSQDLVNINSRGQYGATPLMKAALKGHIDVFEYLVNKKANVSLYDFDGDTILHYASIGGHRKICQYILSLDLVNINSRGKYGRTALMAAACYGQREVFDLLMSKGGLTDLVDAENHNMLHLASLGGRVEMVKHILSRHMTDINARVKEGDTAAMIAKRNGKLDVYNLLVSHGCPAT